MKSEFFYLLSAILIVTAVDGFGASRTYRPLTGRQRDRQEMGSGMGSMSSGTMKLTPLNTKRRRKPKDLFPEVTARQQAGEDEPEEGTQTFTKVVYKGPNSGWGFLKTRAPYYSMEGKNQGKLPAGTLFAYKGTKDSKTATLLVSKIQLEGKWQGPFLLDCRKIAGYEGDPRKIDPEIVKGLQQYFTLCGKSEERREELHQKLNEENPHFASAVASYKKYNESIEKAAEMERQMLQMTGARRYRAQKQLASLKYAQARLKADADQKMSSYKVWKKAHPIDEKSISSDSVLQGYEQERAVLREKFSNLIPQE